MSKKNRKIIFRHFETEDEITPAQIAEIEEILAEILFRRWLKERQSKIKE